MPDLIFRQARPENFPFVNDYRNPLVAGAMKTLGYVNMFNRGVRQVQSDLKDNVKIRSVAAVLPENNERREQWSVDWRVSARNSKRPLPIK